MMTTLILLCLSLPDTRQPAPIPDTFVDEYVVHETFEASTTGCTTAPSSDGLYRSDIVIPSGEHYRMKSDDGDAGISYFRYETGLEPDHVPILTAHDPPGLPNPNPETPPVAVVPEPPTVAILGLSLAALMYLLFGRQRKQKLYRRT